MSIRRPSRPQPVHMVPVEHQGTPRPTKVELQRDLAVAVLEGIASVHTLADAQILARAALSVIHGPDPVPL